MATEILRNAWKTVNGYLSQAYAGRTLQAIRREISALTGELGTAEDAADRPRSYEEVQEILSTLNERETIRKKKGVYYTPQDVVEFIVLNCAKMACGSLKPENLPQLNTRNLLPDAFCCEKTVYDPTCGSGAFLLAALELKLDLLGLHRPEITREEVQKVVGSIGGNDLNGDSIAIAKIRLFLCVLHRCGPKKTRGISQLLNRCFSCCDYVAQGPAEQKYDIVMGNPPYVEDRKSESLPKKRYGNIYANVLENASLQLRPGGVMGFVIPLSYVSTPRMKRIRDVLYGRVPKQYILSYSDRPDCLFVSVHQKLCILLGKNQKGERKIFTSNYRYWYKEERDRLFSTASVVENDEVAEEYIPKLGTAWDSAIYRKLNGFSGSLADLLDKRGRPLYLNMRAAFWIKAFLNEHAGAEYRRFECESQNAADLCFCLLHSSLFWWYWICVSDCWHITKKELRGFRVPQVKDFTQLNRLAAELEDQLEKTKRYVGTKQTEYEYKHKACVDTIHRIDDCINALYGLSEEEGNYIKHFAYRYRIGGGVADGGH